MMRAAAGRKDVRSGEGRPSPERSRAQAGSAGATHRGLRRATNQDAFLDRPDIALWAVADGVGGLAGGEKASRTVIDRLTAIEGCGDLAERVMACLDRANDDLRLEALIGEQGMAATTVVVFAADETRRNFTCFWVGDSRLYRLRAGVLEQITQDHTAVPQFDGSRFSDLSKASAANALSRAIGSEENLDVEQLSGAIEPGDVFLLCTDGLSKPVSVGHIGRLLMAGDAASAPERLIGAALDAGGPDNVTAVVVAFPGKARSRGKGGSALQSARDRSGSRWPSTYIFISIGLMALVLSIVAATAQKNADLLETTCILVAANFVLLVLALLGEVASSGLLRRAARGLCAIIGIAIAVYAILRWSGAALPDFILIQVFTHLLK